MGWNDEYFHHNLVALLRMYRVLNDACIHHNLLKEEKEGGLFKAKKSLGLQQNCAKI